MNVEGRYNNRSMNVDILLRDIVAQVKSVPGVKAIVLGGSRARGTHTAQSDIDLGIYYTANAQLDVMQLAKTAASLDDDRRPDLVTSIGGWGPWINGGGWLRIRGVPVDFLYRDLAQVNRVIEACLAGNVEVDYQPGHPNGFVSSIYLGETAICQPLWDPQGLLAALKARITPYPPALEKALVQKFSWEIDFSIEIAKKGIAKADVAYTAGCYFRSIMCMLQVLFALNHEHWLNEKGAVAMAGKFERKPANLQDRIDEIFALLGPAPESLQKSLAILKGLSRDLSALLPK
ncbi:MAG: nucleotidyltransferase domain-containing protein [Anaerolineales bacterium]|nr:nucleotidyltransferase domain-containing protein [Anaerolineales bacterium]